MAEDSGAQVMHDTLADLVREQGLDDAERAGDDGDHDHPAGVERQRPNVVDGDRLERTLEQERWDHAEPGGHDDEQQDGGKPPPVRREQVRDTPEVGATLHRIRGALRGFGSGVEEHAHRLCQGTPRVSLRRRHVEHLDGRRMDYGGGGRFRIRIPAKRSNAVPRPISTKRAARILKWLLIPTRNSTLARMTVVRMY